MAKPTLSMPSIKQVDQLLKSYHSGNTKLAESNARMFIRVYEKHSIGWKILGGILLQQQKPKEALSVLEKATSLNPKDSEAESLTGLCLSMLGLHKKAEARLCKAIKLQSKNAEFQNNLGLIRRKLRKFDDALICFDKAIELAPEYAGAIFNKANTLNEMGKLERAVELYKKTILLDPSHAGAYRQLLELTKLEKSDALYQQALGLFQSSKIRKSSKIQLGFALAKANEDLSNFDDAMSFYNTANSLQKSILKYNLKDDKTLFMEIRASHAAFNKINLNLNSADIFTPIFIVGMPRSGTSLVEQILSSHSKVYGGGELNHIGNFGRRLSMGLEPVTKKNLIEFRRKYFKETKETASGTPFFTDKMPLNFRYLGLICSAFPEAKIIHVKRSPKAVCWSLYKTWFQATGMKFSYDLNDIVEYYHLYKELMAFWENTLGKRIFSLDYDRLTNNQMEETKMLIKHLGLTWEEDCIKPEENKRAVSTASKMQVRRPVYTGSSENWRAYESFLNGVFDNL